MEAKLILANGISASCSTRIKHMQRRNSYPVFHAVLTTATPPPENISGINLGNTTTGGDPVTKDNWFDRLAIKHLSKSVQATTGLKNSQVGYESLVEAARAVQQNFNTKQQRELVIQALERAFPKPILSLIRILMPNTKISREYFALFTTLFFPWLIGPCEVRESELNGRKEKNVVYMAKCRFLQESNCVGMCTNLCKMPSQTFIKNSLGIPVNMVPNFDDMSCQMVFGQEPPDENEDEAFKQPCYKLCKAKKRHSIECSSYL